MVRLLHLCDSLFPLGSFAHSDGLEAAMADPAGGVSTVRDWIDACLDPMFGRLEGPAVWRAWRLADADDWQELAALDDGVVAMRPAATARRSTRAMGQRLLSTWRALYPDARDVAGRTGSSPSLPVAFAIVCSGAGIERRTAVEAFGYTRLAATVSAAMRLAPIGQMQAHGLLAGALDRLPAVVDRIVEHDPDPSAFTPLMDIAAMSQQYLHARLFRS